MKPVKISLIAAMSKNRVIGIKDSLPWHLPDDLALFKNVTLGHVMVMGRKTLDSLPGLLPGRQHWVLSRTLTSTNSGGVEFFTSIPSLIEKASTMGLKELFVIGGGDIYEQFLPLATQIYLTTVDTTMSGDAYFPELDRDQWAGEIVTHHEQDEKHAFSFKHEILNRKR